MAQTMQIRISFRSRSDLALDADHSLDCKNEFAFFPTNITWTKGGGEIIKKMPSSRYWYEDLISQYLVFEVFQERTSKEMLAVTYLVLQACISFCIVSDTSGAFLFALFA